MLTELEWAYLAGILDGEGCIYLKKNKPHGSIIGAIEIANTSNELATWIMSRFGGKIYFKKSYPGNSKPCYTIRWNGREAGSLLPNLLPYIVIKKRKAELLSALTSITPFQAGKALKPEIKEVQNMLYNISREVKLGI
jgi:hypothetical protein